MVIVRTVMSKIKRSNEDERVYSWSVEMDVSEAPHHTAGTQSHVKHTAQRCEAVQLTA